MKDERIVVHSANKERYYTKCYHDFVDCGLLTGEEKIIFLILKRFLDIRADSGDVFPSIATIQKLTGWGKNKVLRTIKSLQKKGVVTVKRRGLTKNNLYVINDKKDMWKAQTIEELQTAAVETAEEKAIKYLQSIGYTVTKEKEPDKVVKPTTATAKSGTHSNKPKYNPTFKQQKSQENKPRNGFHNFEQRNYSSEVFANLENKRANKGDYTDSRGSGV